MYLDVISHSHYGVQSLLNKLTRANSMQNFTTTRQWWLWLPHCFQRSKCLKQMVEHWHIAWGYCGKSVAVSSVRCKEVGRSKFMVPIAHWQSVPWWRHQMETFPRYWPFVRRIHRSPVNSPHKGHWRGALVFCLICVGINGWINNGEVGD